MQGLEIVELPGFAVASLLLALGLATSLVLEKPFSGGRWKHYYWLVLTQFLFYPAMIAVGVLFAVSANPALRPPKPNSVPGHTIDVLFYLPIALAAFWVYRMKKIRWCAFCFLAFEQLLLFGAALVAGFSVTGDWP